MRRHASSSYPFGLPDSIPFLFSGGKEGMAYDYTKSGVFKQDFNMTPAANPGDPIRIILDALSLNRDKVAFLNGATSTYFSTPDAAVTASTTIRLWARLSAVDITPAASGTIIGQWNTSSLRAFRIGLSTTSQILFSISTDGTFQSNNEVASTALDTVIGNADEVLVDATWTIATKTVVFRYSLDNGLNWNSLGSAVTQDATIFDSSALITVGGAASGQNFIGSIYEAGIDFDGSAFKHFSPPDYSGSGSTFASSTTGETWTRNGQAFIAGDGYHQVAPSDATRRVVARLPRGGFRNFLTATATLSTQNVTTQALEYTLSFKGTGTVTLTGASTDGPLVGTGANDRVSLTFTPTAGTLTLTVSGSVTEAQLELGASVTNYQAVGAGRYDITETGVASVTWTYGAGTQYSSIFGSKNLTWPHDGTGGNAFMGLIVNKADDGADDVFAASSTGSTVIGFNVGIDDASTADGNLAVDVSNGSANIINDAGSASDISRFTPFILDFSYNVSDDPDASARINGTVKYSGDDSGTPSSSAAANDIAIFSDPDGSNVLPGYECGGFFINGLTDAQKANTLSYYKNLMGIAA